MRLAGTLIVASLLAVCALAPTAGAKAIYTYDVEFTEAVVYGSPRGEVAVAGLDTSKSATVRVARGVTEVDRYTVGVGYEDTSFDPSSLAFGDVIEVYQPALPAGPPGVAPIESFTTPALTLAVAPGGGNISGTVAGDVTAATLLYRANCSEQGDDYPVTVTGGAFSFAPALGLAPGNTVVLRTFPGQGDRVSLMTRAAGETPCPGVDASNEFDIPGRPESTTGYDIYITNLRPDVIDTRVVISRGGNAYVDESDATTTSFGKSFATRPLPGDRVDLYRPAGAATPTYSYTLPSFVATFDPAADLVAVDAEATDDLFIEAANSNFADGVRRGISPAAAGRHLFDVSQPTGFDSGIDLTPHSNVQVGGRAAGSPLYVWYNASQGDLVAPTVRAAVAKAFRLRAFKGNKLKLRVHASEASSTTIAVALPRKLPSKRSPRTRKAGKTVQVARLKKQLAAGNKTLTLRLNRTGKKAIKRLQSVGRKLGPVPMIVTITTRDAAGNSTTLVQNAKVAR